MVPRRKLKSQFRRRIPRHLKQMLKPRVKHSDSVFPSAPMRETASRRSKTIMKMFLKTLPLLILLFSGNSEANSCAKLFAPRAQDVFWKDGEIKVFSTSPTDFWRKVSELLTEAELSEVYRATEVYGYPIVREVGSVLVHEGYVVGA